MPNRRDQRQFPIPCYTVSRRGSRRVVNSNSARFAFFLRKPARKFTRRISFFPVRSRRPGVLLSAPLFRGGSPVIYVRLHNCRSDCVTADTAPRLPP